MPDYTALWPGGPLFAQAENQRLCTDSILLADFVRIGQARHGIDLGCGSGILALLLLCRGEKLHMTGLELDANAAERARANMDRNALTGRGEIICGDIRAHRDLFRVGSFDLAAANPPYFPPERGAVSPDPARAAARSETCCTLEELCRAASWLLRTGGSFSAVHRPERLSELFTAMTACDLEPKRLRFVCSRAESAPSLILVEGRRGGRPGLCIEPPLILTGADGGESAELRRIYHR